MQVLVRLLEIVLCVCTSVFFAASVYAVANSAFFWDVCANLGNMVSHLMTYMTSGLASFVG